MKNAIVYLSNGCYKDMVPFQPAVKMTRGRTCILCETVHVSKQEMDEHMRSMLHHRELEKLKGRDCGHECRVCKVTVVSLTDYASHISSPTHKQNVDTVEKKQAGNFQEEDYFDKALVELIEKRKQRIRKEKEAAAAKLAKEEEERKKKEAYQQRLKEAKERFQQERRCLQPPQGFGRPNSWYRGNQYNSRPDEPRHWHNSNPGRSATWHAQSPPNFRNWASGDFCEGNIDTQHGWGNNQRHQGSFFGQNRMPWISNRGSCNGLYGRNNISQYPQRNQPQGFFGSSSVCPPPPNFGSSSVYSNYFCSDAKQNTGNDHDRWSSGFQNQENPESGHNSSKNPKSFGSNPKLDKSSRWSPYPVAKVVDSHPKSQKQEKEPETSALNRAENTPGELTSGGKSVEKKSPVKKNSKQIHGDSSSSSGSKSSSAQRDQISSSGPSNLMANKPLLHKEKQSSSVPSLISETQHCKTSLQVHPQPKAATKPSGITAPLTGPLHTSQAQKLPETFKKEKAVLEKRSSLDSSGCKRSEMAPQIKEEQLKDHVQSQIEVNKENSCRENGAKPNIPESVKSSSSKLPSSDSSHFLQSLQVSTSTMESSEPTSSNREDQVKRAEKEPCSVGLSEAMQAVEAGLASESDNSRSDEAQMVSGSNTSCLSKLDLPPALKRDLTKHISSKTKPGGHEPNLNIARRVRNLSESRRSDTEKDSGLRPTVRQLISSSGSWRSVNWEQVYQEVRKKQDKGKGMPRFGIEMVPCDQEDQSQEEDEIPLLEGFQWDSLMDISAPAGPRKRSLSESSVAPVSVQSLLKETEQRDRLCSEEHKPSIQELQQMLGHSATEPQKQPDNARSETVVALQRADSMLGDSSSGTEQLDGQGAGKRRRAAGDVVQSPEAAGLEHDKKRRKTKSKKERLHIDQLLAVSLREEELSRSLQSVDTSLIQARAALQAAYMEVQRVMVMKEQISAEMSTLRNKRIELLKGMQGTVEEAPQINLKEERMDEAEPHILSSVPQPSATDTAVFPSSGPAAQCAPLPSSMAVVIKEEPKSPVQVGSDLDHLENTPQCGESVLLAASRPDITLDFQPPSNQVNPELNQATEEQERFGEPADSKESLLGLVKTKSCNFPSPDCKVSVKHLAASCSRRGSEVASLTECSASQSFESLSVPSALNVLASPSEMRSGKRVRKLKKRKVLRKAQGTAPPESSDTELDAEASRPRWLRPRRRPSGGSQVSTSSLPREADVNIEEDQVLTIRHDAKFLKPKGVPEVDDAEVITLDSEDSMEITAACQQTHVPSRLHALQLPDSSRTDPHSLACNEVTSTSDMEVCKSSESEMPLQNLKASTDASSDHGQDDIPTEGMFEGHQEAVNAMQIHNRLLYTCSGDRTVKAFDLVSHKCVGVFEGHSSKVSCLLVSAAPSLHCRLYSGSSDQTIRCYSLKTQEFEQQFSLPDRVLCLHSRWSILYAGLANGAVVTFNLRTNKEMDVFECHGPRAVSCLASSQEGARRILLVGSYDSTISVRDANNGLLLRTLEGHTKTVLCMKVVNDLVFSGSSDQCVYTHNIHTGELVRVYKGHSHAVTVVTILGKVMVTACLDKLVRVYDLQSREQLQVYGGHKDMVMCMAINKNMIYTGCYDGSVQAVKLNLMQNYRCWWHGCPMVLGVMEHLQQHLINDHAATNVQKCRWKDCEEFFCTRNSTKQALMLHMQKHAEEEAEREP